MRSGKGVVFLGTADNSRCLNILKQVAIYSSTFSALHSMALRHVRRCGAERAACPGDTLDSLCRERWRVYIVDRHANPSQMQGGFNKSWTRIARRPLRTLFYHILPLGFSKTEHEGDATGSRWHMLIVAVRQLLGTCLSARSNTHMEQIFCVGVGNGHPSGMDANLAGYDLTSPNLPDS